ncbi:hypothetical protein CBS101457_001510 [Exobasidium rhododendri]|nr:hypothetical protein CBS101457_001510 [Exobasidium rhododendri]
MRARDHQPDLQSERPSDTTPFLSDDFDPQEYANKIIEAPGTAVLLSSHGGEAVVTPSTGSWLPQTGRKDLDVEGDVSVALSRLNLAIEDVDRLIREEVTLHAHDLLSHTTTLLALRPNLAILTDALVALNLQQSKLTQRVSVPRATLTAHTSRLSKIRSAQSLVKDSERLTRLVRRLQGQMKSLKTADKKVDDRNRLDRLEEVEGEGEVPNDDLLDTDLGEEKGRGLSRAALTLSEIATLVEPQRVRPKNLAIDLGPGKAPEGHGEALLSNLDFVKDMLPFVDESRERVTDLMEDMVVRGLRDLSPTLLSTSLQTAFNLGQLADLVRDLLADLNDVIRDRVVAAFDMQSLSRELGTREPSLLQASSYTSYKSKRGQTQNDITAQSTLHQKWSTALWMRLETLIVGEMGAVCSKVYTLEKVLSLKSDRLTGINYLDEAMSVLGDRPSAIFWSTLSEAVESQSSKWTKASSFLSQTLSTSYPRFLRLFHEFFDKIAIYTEAVSYSTSLQSPETRQMLDALRHLEESYLLKSKARLDGYLASSFSPQRTAGSQEGSTAAQMAWEELDRAQFDPILLRSVVKMVKEWLLKLVYTIGEQRNNDASSNSLQRNSTSPGQLSNASLTNAIYSLRIGLQKLLELGPEEGKPSTSEVLKEVERLYNVEFVEPLLLAIVKEISETVARMHYVDFGVEQDAVIGGSGGSAYMSDLSDRLWYVREQLLVHYSVEGDKKTWILRIARHALHSFVMHASLVRPLGEGGKLKLTSDMTELEFATSQLLGSVPSSGLTMPDLDVDFKALRSFRSLLFKNNLELAQADLLPQWSGLRPVLMESTRIPQMA